MKKIFIFSILIIITVLSSGCFRHTHSWTVDVDIYNSTLKNVYVNINGESRIIPARSWLSWTVYCEDSETYCDLFEDYNYKDNYYWDAHFIDNSGRGTGYNLVYEEDSYIEYKLYYNNTTNIIFVDRVSY